MDLSDAQVARIQAASAAMKDAYQADPSLADSLQDLFRLLKQSETLMIDLLQGDQPPATQPGDVEYGPTLYLLETHLAKHEPGLLKILREMGLPSTAITPQMLKAWNAVLSTTGVIAGDGTLVAYASVAQYAQFDPGWLVAGLDYILLKLNITSLYKPFPTNPNTVTIASGQTITIAVTGDWGTGPWDDYGAASPSEQVMAQITALDPDYTIHLGDVYYAGWSAEETDNLLAGWYRGSTGTTFTLNSNHEMYDGANGYFSTALASPIFAAQQGTSYFAIKAPNWAIIGLDSAYYDPSTLFMDGAITDPNQVGFLGSFANQPNLIVMTHHNALDVAGTALHAGGGLWNNVVDALGGTAPGFWYWGHIHNGVAYKNVPGLSAETVCRCVGHGALPFGEGYYITQSPDNVEHFANTPILNPVDPYQQLRVQNGFMLLTLTDDTVTEQFYNQSSAIPVWSKSHSLARL